VEQEKKCPKCGGTRLEDERHLGAQTGDLQCVACGYTAWPTDECWTTGGTDKPPKEKR